MLPRRVAIALRWLAAALLVACAFAHSLGGWPPFATELAARGVEGETTSALRIGWMWGGAAFVAFALAAALAARARPEEERLAGWLLLAIGAVTALFGVWAMASRNGNPFFLLFVFLGLLLALGASVRR